MSEIVELVSTTAATAPKFLYLLGILILAVIFADRGRKAAALEQEEESSDRRAA